MRITPEERLVGFAVRVQEADLEPAVREKAVHLLLDAVSLARMAEHHPVVRAVRSLTDGDAGPAHSWSSGLRLPATAAALENGTATHAHFHDDTDMSAWAHPASLVVPAVVAAAEHVGAEMPDVLRGLVSGYAALSWLAAREEVSRALVEGGHRASPTLGAVAAAVGASTTLRLDAGQTADALGIAVDSTGGLLEPVRDGAQDWRLQNGFAAQRGLVAALLGRAGVRGPARPLTGPTGFLASFASSDPWPAQWEEPPEAAAVLGVWFKPYPTLGDNMAPAVAASLLHARATGVSSVSIEMNAHFASYPGTAYRGPFERVEQAIASTAFAVAALLVHGDLAYADYDRLLGDPDVLRLVAATTIAPREDFGYLDGTVTVDTSSGVLESHAADAPQTLFFRDAATTRTVLATRGQDGLVEVADRLYAALTKEEWPSPRQLIQDHSR